MNRLKKQSEKPAKEQSENRRQGLFQQWITGITATAHRVFFVEEHAALIVYGTP